MPASTAQTRVLSGTAGELGATEQPEPGLNALAWLDDWFSTYIEDRRREPRGDVLTDLALARYPDGSTPDVTAVVRTATFLFAAGQETTARLLATALKYLAEYPQFQDELRADRERLPDFIEEALRSESPVKADFRLARRATTVGGVDIGAGMPVMLLNGAANRDPRHFECPAEFRIDRQNAREHIAFGRGAHSCPGGSLARVEAGVSLVQVNLGNNETWDTHGEAFPHLKDKLLPPTDRALSALLDDLSESGLLESTLIVMAGEFGRTPKITHLPQHYKLPGRDHWGAVQTVLFAGGGVRGGTVIGSSDRIGGYPASDPQTPEQMAATIYEALGIPATAVWHDEQDRPHAIYHGEPIVGLS